MKLKLAKLALVVAIVLAFALYLVLGVVRTERLPPAQFVEKGRTYSGSVYDIEFVGVAQGRAYLSEWRLLPVVGTRIRLLWTEADRLPPEVLQEFAAAKAENDRQAKASRDRQAAGGK
jgi:hypothetical protein